MHRLPERWGLPYREFPNLLASSSKQGDTKHSDRKQLTSYPSKSQTTLGDSPVSMKGLRLSMTGYSITLKHPSLSHCLNLFPDQWCNSSLKQSFTLNFSKRLISLLNTRLSYRFSQYCLIYCFLFCFALFLLAIVYDFPPIATIKTGWDVCPLPSAVEGAAGEGNQRSPGMSDAKSHLPYSLPVRLRDVCQHFRVSVFFSDK